MAPNGPSSLANGYVNRKSSDAYVFEYFIAESLLHYYNVSLSIVVDDDYKAMKSYYYYE